MAIFIETPKNVDQKSRRLCPLFVFDRLIGMSVWYRGGGVSITHTSFLHVAISNSTPWCGITITLCVSLIPRPSHVFQHFTQKTLKNMRRPGYETIVCIHYDLEHFVHGTQCMFSKLMQDEDGNTALIASMSTWTCWNSQGTTRPGLMWTTKIMWVAEHDDFKQFGSHTNAWCLFPEYVE